MVTAWQERCIRRNLAAKRVQSGQERVFLLPAFFDYVSCLSACGGPVRLWWACPPVVGLSGSGGIVQFSYGMNGRINDCTCPLH